MSSRFQASSGTCNARFGPVQQSTHVPGTHCQTSCLPAAPSSSCGKLMYVNLSTKQRWCASHELFRPQRLEPPLCLMNTRQCGASLPPVPHTRSSSLQVQAVLALASPPLATHCCADGRFFASLGIADSLVRVWFVRDMQTTLMLEDTLQVAVASCRHSCADASPPCSLTFSISLILAVSPHWLGAGPLSSS